MRQMVFIAGVKNSITLIIGSARPKPTSSSFIHQLTKSLNRSFESLKTVIGASTTAKLSFSSGQLIRTCQKGFLAVLTGARYIAFSQDVNLRDRFANGLEPLRCNEHRSGLLILPRKGCS